jgi:hypothetical protein
MPNNRLKARMNRPSTGFDSLTLALEDWFDTPLCDLPESLRLRVKKEFFPMPWDGTSADQRRSVALQLDYQHDPATESDQQYWWDFFERERALKTQLAQWEVADTPTAGELAFRETRLKELRQELARMAQQQRQARGDYYPERKRTDGAMPNTPAKYLAYPKAMKLLANRLNAAPEELAAWVWMGPQEDGLAAYLNANELDPPPRFYYFTGTADDFDYLSPLMACWFKEDDIAAFDPADRYLTGKALIARWSAQPGIQPEAFIRAKIAESRLLDIHPIYGGTQGSFPQQDALPALVEGLFLLAQVEAVEAEDFGVEVPVGVALAAVKPTGHLNHDLTMQARANEIAAEKRKATGRPITRDKVAQLLAAELGMAVETVLRRIRKQW